LVYVLACGKGEYFIFLYATFDVLTAVLLKIKSLLGCDAVYLVLYFLIFQRIAMPSSLG
jgi:hypothetical protein